MIKEILSHLGVADVKEFGLSWDECYDYLSRLGYRVKLAFIKGSRLRGWISYSVRAQGQELEQLTFL